MDEEDDSPEMKQLKVSAEAYGFNAYKTPSAWNYGRTSEVCSDVLSEHYISCGSGLVVKEHMATASIFYFVNVILKLPYVFVKTF